MTQVSYPQGYGRRDPVPECVEWQDRIDCPCCKGTGEHGYGAGMDADSVDCVVCGGWGQLAVSRITKAEERNGRTE